jgi:hypothetical protein
MPLPAFHPPSPPAAETAPYLLVTIDGHVRRLDIKGLRKLLFAVTGTSSESQPGDWKSFAQDNELLVCSLPIVAPDFWIKGTSRWVAVALPTESEAHIYYGFLASSNGGSYTHIDVAKDSKRWLPKLPRAATLVRHILFHRPVCNGSAMIAGQDSGITATTRQTFVKTLTDKDAAVSALAVLAASFGSLAKTGNFTLSTIGESVIVLVLVMLTISVLRHFLTLPALTWAVEKLKD